MMNRKVFQQQRSGESLDSFSERCVVTPSDDLAKLKKEVDEFVRFLHQEFSRRSMSVAEVKKSGSLGKGTAVRDNADIDLVVFFNGLNNVYDLINNRETLLDQIEEGVKNYVKWRGRIQRQCRTSFSVQYSLDGHDIDLLPAFAFDLANDKNNRDLMYKHMAEVATKEGGGKKGQAFVANQFSASLASLQVDFVKHEDESVKKVIRLLKKWKKENRPNDLRSYTIELVTIHTARAVRAAGNRITTDDLFTRTLEILAGSRQLDVYFEDNYIMGPGHNDPNGLWSHSVPCVVDVANPYNNTLHGTNTGKISQMASDTLQTFRH